MRMRPGTGDSSQIQECGSAWPPAAWPVLRGVLGNARAGRKPAISHNPNGHLQMSPADGGGPALCERRPRAQVFETKEMGSTSSKEPSCV